MCSAPVILANRVPVVAGFARDLAWADLIFLLISVLAWLTSGLILVADSLLLLGPSPTVYHLHLLLKDAEEFRAVLEVQVNPGRGLLRKHCATQKLHRCIVGGDGLDSQHTLELVSWTDRCERSHGSYHWVKTLFVLHVVG